MLLSGVALVVVVALVVGLLFVLGVFKSDKGASSPEDAVAKLVSSTVAFKSSSALNALAPGEINGFAGLQKAATSPSLKAAGDKLKSELESLSKSDLGSSMPGVFGQGFDGLSGVSQADVEAGVKAVSVKLTGLKYRTTKLADGIADVEIVDGTITVSADSSKIPANLRKQLKTIIQDSNVPDVVTQLLDGNTTVTKTVKIGDYVDQAAKQGQKFDAIVVRQDGSWYVSLYGTIAQHVYEGVAHDRQANGDSPLAQPDWNLYANPPKAIVAASVEQVPANLAKAISDESVQEIFQNLPQNEVRALYPYVPLLQSAAGSDANGTTLEISGVQATTTGTDGNLVHVIYTQGTATSTEGGKTSIASVHNGCYTADGDKQCVSDWPNFAQSLAKVFGMDKGIPLTLRKVDGGYQLDPIGTYVGLVSAVLNHADQLVDAFTQFMDYVQKQLEQLSSQSS